MDSNYCKSLGIGHAPSLEQAASDRRLRLFSLMILAILEHGSPMPLATIAKRLARAGVTAADGNLELSLKRAWHGLPPVLRLPDGRYDLDLDSNELQRHLARIMAPAPRWAYPPLFGDTTPSGDHGVPLTKEEVAFAFKRRCLGSMSGCRQAAAILDAYGSPISHKEVERKLARYTKSRGRLPTPAKMRRSNCNLVWVSEADELHLLADSPGLPALRNMVRRMADSGRKRAARAALTSPGRRRRARRADATRGAAAGRRGTR